MQNVKDDLDNILKFLHDSFDCYETNMEDVSDDNLKELFGFLSQQRLQMIDEIKDLIIELGGEPKSSLALVGKICEFDEILESIDTSEESLDMMGEIRHAEKMLIDCYNETLMRAVPEKVKSLLLNHLAQIGEELKRVDVITVSTMH